MRRLLTLFIGLVFLFNITGVYSENDVKTICSQEGAPRECASIAKICPGSQVVESRFTEIIKEDLISYGCQVHIETLGHDMYLVYGIDIIIGE